MTLLGILKGATVFTSVAAMVALSAAQIELWIHRYEERDPDFYLVIRVLSVLSFVGWWVCALLTVNYWWRFYTGLPGSRLPGPESNSLIALTSFVAVYGFFIMVGVMLMYLLWVSDEPSEEERERRRRIARERIQREVAIQQRNFLRGGRGWKRR